MRSIFNPESRVMRLMTRICDLIILNIMFILFSVPVITIGASTTALYRVLMNFRNQNDASPIKQFWLAFKSNLKAAIQLLLMLIIPIAIFIICFQALFFSDDPFSYGKITLVVPLVLVGMMMSYVWPLQAQFSNRLGTTIKNAIILAVAHLPRSLLMTVFNFIPLLLCVIMPAVFIDSLFFWLLLGYSLIAQMNTNIVSKIFVKYADIDSEDN